MPLLDGMPIHGCIGLRGTAVGTATATIAIGALTTEVPVNVVPAGSSLPGPPFDPGATESDATPGERASR